MPEESKEETISCVALSASSLDYKLRTGDALDSEGKPIVFANYHPPSKDDGTAPGFVDKNFRLNRLRGKAKEEENSVSTSDTREDANIVGNGSKNTRATFLKAHVWPSYPDKFTELRVAFIDGTDSQHRQVAQIANEWTVGTGVRFHFGAPLEGSHIRVSFDPNCGSQSKIGKKAEESTTGMTLNLSEVSLHTILHEFGHVMGLGHEHQSPARGFKIKEQETLQFFKGVMDWDEDTTRNEFIYPYMTGSTNHSEYDPLSVMNYNVPSRLIRAPKGVAIPPEVRPNALSRLDREWVQRQYPPPILSPQPPLILVRPNPPVPNWENQGPPVPTWNRPNVVPPVPVWNTPNPLVSIPPQSSWTNPTRPSHPTWTNPSPYLPNFTNPNPNPPNWTNPNPTLPTWMNPQPIPQPQPPPTWTNPVNPNPGYPLVAGPALGQGGNQWQSHTRRLLNTTTANWNLFPGSIPGTVKGEILWTDGNPVHTFPGRPTMRAYSVVRRQPPQDPSGVVIAQGLASQVNFQLLD